MRPSEIIAQQLSAELGHALPSRPTEKSARPSQVAFVDIRLCEPCGACIEPCPAACIETLPSGSVPDRDAQPVQVRYDDCVGCGLCVEICTLICDRDAIRMYDVNLVEQVLGVDVGESKPAEHPPIEPWEDYWAEEGGYRHMGTGSRLADKLDRAEIEALRAETGAD